MVWVKEVVLGLGYFVFQNRRYNIDLPRQFVNKEQMKPVLSVLKYFEVPLGVTYVMVLLVHMLCC